MQFEWIYDILHSCNTIKLKHLLYPAYRFTDINIFKCAACGVKLQYGKITTVGGLQGEWQTLNVEFHGGDRSYLQVNKLFCSNKKGLWPSMNDLIK